MKVLKPSSLNNYVVCAIVLGLLWVSATVTAQTFTVIKNFNYVDGYDPWGSLTLSDGVLYGTTRLGGGSDGGTVYKMNTDGTDYTVLKNFSDGAALYAGVTLVDGMLYGTTRYGGVSNYGTVFIVSTNGTGYSVLKSFTGVDGRNPYAAVIYSDGMLYGTTKYGGVSDNGTVYKLNANGTGYTVLKSFNGTDGRYPYASLTLSSNVLYGTTQSGGDSENGTVFKLNTDGTGYKVLKRFSALVSQSMTNSDGSSPWKGLILSSNMLYGTAHQGGISNYGTVFRMKTDGTDFTVLKYFTGIDGAAPYAGLILSSNILYGTTRDGGIYQTDPGSSNPTDGGTVFQLNTDGTGFNVLRNLSFTNNSGGGPYAGVILSGSTLYGAALGGSTSYGTVFKIDLSSLPSLTAQALDDVIVLGWNNPSFTLQAAPEAEGNYTNIAGAISPYTNVISGPQRFFRLIRN